MDGKLQQLHVLEHDLWFDAQGWADGCDLTQAEIERLRQFHFQVVEEEQKFDPPIPTIRDVPVQTRPKETFKTQKQKSSKRGEK